MIMFKVFRINGSFWIDDTKPGDSEIWMEEVQLLPKFLRMDLLNGTIQEVYSDKDLEFVCTEHYTLFQGLDLEKKGCLDNYPSFYYQ